jgi:hypothetical protein
VDELRITMPISYRAAGDASAGNRFTPARLTIPVSIDDPIKRVRTIRDRCSRARKEPALPLTDAVAGVLDALPSPITTLVLGSMLKHVDVVASNVSGIRQPIYLEGVRVQHIFGFGPLTGAAVNVTLYSHGDRCCVGITSDDASVPDPDVLLACLEEGFAEICGLAEGPSG